MTPEEANDPEAFVAQVKREILADIAAGVVPASVSEFGELHEYTDANYYGGLCDDEQRAHLELEPWLAMQEAVDAWLRAGRPTD